MHAPDAKHRKKQCGLSRLECILGTQYLNLPSDEKTDLRWKFPFTSNELYENNLDEPVNSA